MKGVKEHQVAVATILIFLCLGVAATLYSSRRGRAGTLPIVRTTHSQFTFTGDAYEPAISPDGLFVAYVSRKPGEPEKLIVQAANGSSVELARDTNLWFPRWSPNGSQILFFRLEPELFQKSPTANNEGIAIVSRLGGTVHSIDKDAMACWITRDGSELVTAREAESSGIRLVNVSTGESKPLHLSSYTYVEDLDCSHQAGLVAAVTLYSGKFQIRTFKPDGSEERVLVEETDRIFSARWSGTADSIYFLHGKGSTRTLSRISASSRQEPITISNGLETGEYFTLSADGSRMAYSRRRGDSNLWQVQLRSRKERMDVKQITTGTFYYGTPSFSPDGKWISFARWASEGAANIYKADASGGQPLQLTFFEHAMAVNPVWSPDGQQIAFVGDQGGKSRVWIINANGGSPQPLQQTDASDSNFELAWWPNNDILYQKAGLRNFYRLDGKTQTESPVIMNPDGWYSFQPVFSPDGKKIAAAWMNKDAIGLALVSLKPPSQALILAGRIEPFGWSPDGEFIYAIRGTEVIRIRANLPHDVVSIVKLPGVDSGAVSPDGREIIVSITQQKSDIWLMENFDSSLPR